MDRKIHTESAPSFRANIWKLNAIQGLTQALFAIPIFFLFLRSHGLNLQEVFILQAAFSLAALLLEIPTGYLADRFGRKKTLILAGFFDVAGFLAYAFGTNFWQFLLAEITIAVGVSLRSGAVEAITYDSLLAFHEERTYKKVSGMQNFFESLAEASSGLLGGFIAVYSLSLPFLLSALPPAIALFIAITLKEPPRHIHHEKNAWKTMWDVIVHTLLRHRGLRSIILLYGLLSTLTLTFFWFLQPYQVQLRVPTVYFGLSHALLVMAGALAALSISHMEKLMDDRRLLMGISVMVVFSILVAGLPPSLLLLSTFFVSRIAWGLFGLLTGDLVNRMTESGMRATVLSVRSFVGRILFVCTSPFIGMLADNTSISIALTMTGSIGGILLVIAFVSVRRAWREIPS